MAFLHDVTQSKGLSFLDYALPAPVRAFFFTTVSGQDRGVSHNSSTWRLIGRATTNQVDCLVFRDRKRVRDHFVLPLRTQGGDLKYIEW